jgi:hypothetical protein
MRLAVALHEHNVDQARDALEKLANMGATLSVGSRKLVGSLVGADAVGQQAAALDSNALPIVSSRLYTSISAANQLIEGLMWDSRRHRLFAASVMDRQLLLVAGANTRPYLQADVGGLFGGVYNKRDDSIWVASSAAVAAKSAGHLFNGLVRFDLTRKAYRRIATPGGAALALGDVTIAADGTVYTSDGLSGGVYYCRPRCSTLRQLVSPGRLFSSQGMVVTPNSRHMYIGDYRYGLAVIDLPSGRIARVLAPSSMMLDGIDALISFKGDLIAVQNGTAPVRIIRIHLSKDGSSVDRLTIIERNNPEWGEATLATVADGKVLYVADGQWARFTDGVATAPGKPTPIRLLNLR